MREPDASVVDDETQDEETTLRDARERTARARMAYYAAAPANLGEREKEYDEAASAEADLQARHEAMARAKRPRRGARRAGGGRR